MDNNLISQTAWDLIYLIHCALHGKKAAAERARTFDLKSLFEQAQFHSLTAMAAAALEGQRSPEEMAPWKEAREKALRKNILLDTERRHLCGVMAGWGIWYMPLKGSVMKDLYPSMEMRQMTDQDILFDTTHRAKMREYMLARGYDPKGHNDTHHDIYHKPPVYNIELHHTLFEKSCDLKLVDYYQNVKQRMIPDAPGSFGYHFSDEDFYIYMIAHAYKHYLDHGVGLRSFVDIYVYETKKGGQLDWAYIERECALLGMDEYERQCRELSRKLFTAEEPQTLTSAELDILKYCFESGTHGDEAGHIRHELKQLQDGGTKITFWTKLRYLMKRLFPSLEWMKQKSKMVRKHPWTLPFAWIARLARGIFKKGEHTSSELRYVMDAEEL